MIRSQFQIRCSFKNGSMFHHSKRFPNTQKFYKNITTRLSTSVTVLFEKKAWTGYMIFRYTHVSKVLLSRGREFRLRGDSIVFAHKSLISAESTIHRILFPSCRLFFYFSRCPKSKYRHQHGPARRWGESLRRKLRVLRVEL